MWKIFSTVAAALPLAHVVFPAHLHMTVRAQAAAGGCDGTPSPRWFREEERDRFFSRPVGRAHMRQPEAFSSPLFPDLDGDGSLEYFCNNHYGLLNYGLPSEGSVSGNRFVAMYVVGACILRY